MGALFRYKSASERRYTIFMNIYSDGGSLACCSEHYNLCSALYCQHCEALPAQECKVTVDDIFDRVEHLCRGVGDYLSCEGVQCFLSQNLPAEYNQGPPMLGERRISSLNGSSLWIHLFWPLAGHAIKSERT